MSALPLVAHAGATKLTVGVADLVVTADASAMLVTYALGSCLGITVFDPVAKVAGMLHAMLPDSAIDPAKAAANPAMFVDTGVPELFRQAYKLGATKERLVCKVAGGAAVLEGAREDLFEIGKRNFVMLRKLLWKNGVLLKAQDVGSNVSRTMLLSAATGEVTLKINGMERTL